MDNDPKHTSHSTRRFIILNNIYHFETPPQSPDLIPIEMVWLLIKIVKVYYLDQNNLNLGLERLEKRDDRNKNKKRACSKDISLVEYS